MMDFDTIVCEFGLKVFTMIYLTLSNYPPETFSVLVILNFHQVYFKYTASLTSSQTSID